MPQTAEISIVDLKSETEQVVVILVEPDRKLGSWAKKLDKATSGQIARALTSAEFKGKARTACDIPGIDDGDVSRVIAIGTGPIDDQTEKDWTQLGGFIAGQLAGRRIRAASVIAETSSIGGKATSELAAHLAFGGQLRGYAFEAYKTNAKNDDSRPAILGHLKIHAGDEKTANAEYVPKRAVGEGVALARDLVNEPANRLGPLEFAAHCEALREVGVEVEILDVPTMEDMRFDALLAVGQGSERPSRTAIMRWNGAKSKRTKPVCFIGKGVVFDTGGISMKPAGGMEDMKGDMGGAACVVGLMHALAAREASVNAIGLVGLVENMPSGKAMRPGDIIGSRAGKTIEVLNTDAEGRLVLADLLAYAEETYSPKFMINLATLTGAIIIGLGKEHAGLFSNDDALSEEIAHAGLVTGERVWRLPLDKGYDKLLDSKVADMKNIGGRTAGAITAAQFLQRFVDDTPWAHLDIAGVAFDSPKSEINPSWGSGWGVQLLDRLVADGFEK